MYANLEDAAHQMELDRIARGDPREIPMPGLPTPNVAKVEMDLNHVWMRENPEIAVEKLIHWSLAHRDCFTLTIDARRDGYTTLRAVRNKPNEVSAKETLGKVAANYNELMVLQRQQRDLITETVRSCLRLLRSPNSLKRKEGLDGLEQLAGVMEGPKE